MAKRPISDAPKSRKMTKLATLISHQLGALGQPVITPYELFLLIYAAYRSGESLYLRGAEPGIEDFRRTIRILRDHSILESDKEYGSRAYRILLNNDSKAEDICCLVDPFCYVSHLSAMQRYGVTVRRSVDLMITTLTPRKARKFIDEKMAKDYLAIGGAVPDESKSLVLTTHPSKIRKRKVSVFHTGSPGESVSVKSSFARIATIGQVFLETVEQPPLCGGMRHVIEVWKEYAQIYLDEIIATVGGSQSQIAKVRAGYILQEAAGLNDQRVESWQAFAQRGGSRVLDPDSPYKPEFSEDWMISINV